jgi:hypothetical protein
MLLVPTAHAVGYDYSADYVGSLNAFCLLPSAFCLQYLCGTPRTTRTVSRAMSSSSSVGMT